MMLPQLKSQIQRTWMPASSARYFPGGETKSGKRGIEHVLLGLAQKISVEWKAERIVHQ